MNVTHPISRPRLPKFGAVDPQSLLGLAALAAVGEVWCLARHKHHLVTIQTHKDKSRTFRIGTETSFIKLPLWRKKGPAKKESAK